MYNAALRRLPAAPSLKRSRQPIYQPQVAGTQTHLRWCPPDKPQPLSKTLSPGRYPSTSPFSKTLSPTRTLNGHKQSWGENPPLTKGVSGGFSPQFARTRAREQRRMLSNHPLDSFSRLGDLFSKDAVVDAGPKWNLGRSEGVDLGEDEEESHEGRMITTKNSLGDTLHAVNGAGGMSRLPGGQHRCRGGDERRMRGDHRLSPYRGTESDQEAAERRRNKVGSRNYCGLPLATPPSLSPSFIRPALHTHHDQKVSLTMASYVCPS